MTKRKFRAKPFCWQDKEIIRYIQNNFKDKSRAPAIALYVILTLKASDQDSESKTRNKLIYLAKTTGLRFDRVKNLLRRFRQLGIINSRQDITREGKFGDTLVVLLAPKPSVKFQKTPKNDESKKTKLTECKIPEGLVKNRGKSKGKTESKILEQTECKKGSSFSQTVQRFRKTNEINILNENISSNNKLTKLPKEAKTMHQVIHNLINHFKSLVKQRENITPEIPYATAANRITFLLTRTEERFVPQQIADIFDFYIESPKYKDHGANINAALSAHTLNLYKLKNNSEDYE